MSDILVAKVSALVFTNDGSVNVHKGRTTVREGHPILKGREHLFEPLRVDYELPSAKPVDAEPSPKDVRAWAAEQGIDVPARGKIAPEIVEQYKAAH